MAQTERTDKVPSYPAIIAGHSARTGRERTSLSMLERIYASESQRFVLWLPVCLGVGIGVYFMLAKEPAATWALVPLLPLALIASGLARRGGWILLAVVWLTLMMTGGFAAAIVSARLAAAPVITHPIGETVEGRVLELSRSRSGAPRILLDAVTIYGLTHDDTPARVRLTLLDQRFDRLPMPGEWVRVYASLLPAGRAVEPGGFDFNRRAFFQRLGGIGLTRGHLLILPQQSGMSPMDTARIMLARVRHDLSRGLRDALPGPSGAFAAAIIVGDRVDIQEEDAEALRASNLAHLLAISGLHMGILTGIIFVAIRIGLSLPPGIALRYSTKKWAAAGALLAGLCYLFLSGATVATQRAFVMVAVAFVAIMLDRPAITLRGLALAAAIILLVRPISLLDAGFQMSFAATAALVAGFEATRGRNLRLPLPDGVAWTVLRIFLVYVGALLFSSLLAGVATAPISAFHFNRTAPYGLLANLLAVPVMGLWIAPWACIAAVLAPFGLAGPALTAMGWGIDHVLVVAHWVAAMPGAVRPVAAAPGYVLTLLTLGGLWLILWRGSGRWLGLGGILLALGAWWIAPSRPDVLVSPGAKLVGVLQSEGRALDHPTTQSFAAQSWLRRDGDPSSQDTAASRADFDRGAGWMASDLAFGWRLHVVWGRDPSPQLLQNECRSDVVLVARHGPALSGQCIYVGAADLAEGGALAIRVGLDGPQLTFAEDPSRQRLWSR
ncbi:MAG: ComEC/Rec2 family competence protein [Pseudomonadota bacterium]